MKTILFTLFILISMTLFSETKPNNLIFYTESGDKLFSPIKEEFEEKEPWFVSIDKTQESVLNINELIKEEKEEDVPPFIQKKIENLFN